MKICSLRQSLLTVELRHNIFLNTHRSERLHSTFFYNIFIQQQSNFHQIARWMKIKAQLQKIILLLKHRTHKVDQFPTTEL